MVKYSSSTDVADAHGSQEQSAITGPYTSSHEPESELPHQREFRLKARAGNTGDATLLVPFPQQHLERGDIDLHSPNR